jgi:quinol monooxygenase YgiN
MSAIRTSREHIAAEVVEFTLNVKPGHYAQVLALSSDFAETYMDVNPALMSALVVGDEGSGLVRGIAVYSDHDEAAAVNSDALFGAFMDTIEPLIDGAPNRLLLDLFHALSR